MIDQKLIENIKSEYGFVKDRLIKCMDKWGGEIPPMFNVYSRTIFEKYAPTLTTSCDRASSSAAVLIKEKNKMNNEYAIRKLTPTECFKLMGLTKNDIDKCRELKVSDSQLYKQAGNGIVTNCPQLLFEHLYKTLYDENYICTDENKEYKTFGVDNKQDITANVLFSGVGMQERGIENSGCWNLTVNHTSEIEMNAVVSYAAIHCGLTQEIVDNYTDYPSREEMAKQLSEINLGYDPVKNKKYDWDKLARRKSNEINIFWLANKLSNNLGDINKIEELPYADLWTYSFPCTDLSVAGKMQGMIKGKTRSGLLYEVERLLDIAELDDTLPKFLMLENVKNLTGKQFRPQFEDWLNKLSDYGYNNYWAVINAKDCGIPQNRERVFVISIRNDIDNGRFTMPTPFDNGLRLKDMLEDDVDEKYYITNDRASQLIEELIENGTLDSLNEDNTPPSAVSLSHQATQFEKEISVSHTLMARDYKGFGNQPMTGVVDKIPCDKTIHNPQRNEYANCICSRYDNGITKRAKEGTAIIEKKGNK